MKRRTIPAGWLTLRPFTTADISWVYQVSQDLVLQHFVLVEVPSPYRWQDAAFYVERAIANWDSGQRAEFLAEDSAAGARMGRVGLDLAASASGIAQIGYWVDARARNRGVATDAVRAVCRWGFTTLGLKGDLVDTSVMVISPPEGRVI
jgi:RimJ/RimL family protein N-acetyltransferase